MLNNWKEIKDSNGNKLLVRLKPVYVLKRKFDVQKHIEQLYITNTKQIKISA